MKRIPVLIADDHPLFREGVRALLLRDGRFDVVAEAADGESALRELRTGRAAAALLDHSMPGLSGLDVVRAARSEGLPARCALLSSYGKPMLVAEALRAGADGYFLKEDSTTTLVDGTARIAAGECAISPAVDRAALRDAMNSLAVTGREADVLKHLVLGASATEIAATLGISPRTVETYRNQLVTKFGARNAVDLVRRAVEAGFVLPGKPSGPADI